MSADAVQSMGCSRCCVGLTEKAWHLPGLDAAPSGTTFISSPCTQLYFSWKTIFLKSNYQWMEMKAWKEVGLFPVSAGGRSRIHLSCLSCSLGEWLAKDRTASPESKSPGFTQEGPVAFRAYLDPLSPLCFLTGPFIPAFPWVSVPNIVSQPRQLHNIPCQTLHCYFAFSRACAHMWSFSGRAHLFSDANATQSPPWDNVFTVILKWTRAGRNLHPFRQCSQSM